MRRKIVAITSQYLKEPVSQIVSELKLNCDIQVVSYNKFDTISEVYDSYAGDTDGFLISGKIAKAAIESTAHAYNRPIVSFEIDIAGLYRALLNLLISNRDLDMDRIILDFLIPIDGGCTATAFLKELDIDTVPPHINNWTKALTRTSISTIENHVLSELIRMWNNNEMDMVLCQYSNILPELRAHGIPTIYPLPSVSHIRDLANELLSTIELEHMRSNLPVIINVSPRSSTDNTPENIQQIYVCMEDFFKKNLMNCISQKVDNHCSALTTVEMLQHITHNNKVCELNEFLTDKLHFEGPIWKGHTSFSLSARATHTAFFKNLIVDKDDYYADKYNYYFYDINAKVNHKFNDRSRLFIGFYKGKDHYHFDTTDSNNYYQNNDETKVYYKDDSHLNWGNTIAYGRWNYVFNSKLFCNTTISYNNYLMKLNQDVEDTRTYRGQILDRYSYLSQFRSGISDWSARMDFDFTPAPEHHIKFGAEYIHHTFRPGISTSKTQEVENGEQQEETIYAASNNHVLRGQEVSLYAEDNFNLNSHLSLNAGIRASLFSTQGKNYCSIQPRLSTRYNFGQGFSAKASYTCMAQYVHLLSSTPFSMPTDLWVPITKNIRPMYANQYSLGGYYTGLAGWEFSIEGYYKQMRHILEYQDGVSFFGTSTNWEEKVEMGEGRSFGLEMMVQKTLGKTTGWLAYTLAKTDHRFKDGAISQGKWFPYKYDRRHTISLCLNHKFSERIDVGASWIFNTGGCITVPERETIIIRPEGNIESAPYISRRNNYRLPASHRLNLGINFNKKTKHGMRTWNISLYNAYNAMNPNLVYSKWEQGYNLIYNDFYNSIYQGNGNQYNSEKKSKTVIKKLTILPCIPSVTYTYKF